MKRTHLLQFLLCLSIIPFQSACGNKTDLVVYGNEMILNGQKYAPIVSSVLEETTESVKIKLFEPYDDALDGILTIPKYSIGQTIDISKDKECVKMSYTEKGKEPADLNLVSGTMEASKMRLYGIKIRGTDENGELFLLDIVPDGLKLQDDGTWTAGGTSAPLYD